MCSRIAAAFSDGLGYTSRNTTPCGANRSTIRRTSGAYRLEIGQSVLVKRNTIAFVPAGAASASTGAPASVWTITASSGKTIMKDTITKKGRPEPLGCHLRAARFGAQGSLALLCIPSVLYRVCP